MHYRARTALLTSIEFDHADIYTDMAHYESAYERFCATLPGRGWLGVSASYPRAVEIARAHSRAPVVTYGVTDDADYRARDVQLRRGRRPLRDRRARRRSGRACVLADVGTA